MVHVVGVASLEMRWLPVQTDSGRTRMEAVWIVVDPTVARPGDEPTVASSGHAA